MIVGVVVVEAVGEEEEEEGNASFGEGVPPGRVALADNGDSQLAPSSEEEEKCETDTGEVRWREGTGTGGSGCSEGSFGRGFETDDFLLTRVPVSAGDGAVGEIGPPVGCTARCVLIVRLSFGRPPPLEVDIIEGEFSEATADEDDCVTFVDEEAADDIEEADDGGGDDDAGAVGGRSGSTVRGCDMDLRRRESSVSI